MQHLRPFFISRRYNDLQILHSALAESSHDGRRNDSRSNTSQFHKLLSSLSPLRLPEIFPDDSERTYLIVTPRFYSYTQYTTRNTYFPASYSYLGALFRFFIVIPPSTFAPHFDPAPYFIVHILLAIFFEIVHFRK